MDGDVILNFLVGLHPVLPTVLGWVGFVAVVFIGVVSLSPWKGDDEALAKVKAMPVVGSILAALIKFSPFKPKE